MISDHQPLGVNHGNQRYLFDIVNDMYNHKWGHSVGMPSLGMQNARGPDLHSLESVMYHIYIYLYHIIYTTYLYHIFIPHLYHIHLPWFIYRDLPHLYRDLTFPRFRSCWHRVDTPVCHQRPAISTTRCSWNEKLHEWIVLPQFCWWDLISM